MFCSVKVSEHMTGEVTINGRNSRLSARVNESFVCPSVPNQISNGDQEKIMFIAEFDQLWESGHSPVFIDYFS
tara:strand:- start:142 stop:360 length:219 start_codon:yes stop_codon:yes gene_type:complete